MVMMLSGDVATRRMYSRGCLYRGVLLHNAASRQEPPGRVDWHAGPCNFTSWEL
jgi:hypothetical protein